MAIASRIFTSVTPRVTTDMRGVSGKRPSSVHSAYTIVTMTPQISSSVPGFDNHEKV